MGTYDLSEVYRRPAKEAIPILLEVLESGPAKRLTRSLLVLKEIQDGQLVEALAHYRNLVLQDEKLEVEFDSWEKAVRFRGRLALIRVGGRDQVGSSSLEGSVQRLGKFKVQTPLDRLEASWFAWAGSVLLGRELLEPNSMPKIDSSIHETVGEEIICKHSTLRQQMELAHAAGDGALVLTTLPLDTEWLEACSSNGDCALTIWLEILKDHCPRVKIPEPLWARIVGDIKSTLEDELGSLADWRLPVGVRWASALLQLAPTQGSVLPDWVVAEAHKGLSTPELPLRIRAAAALARHSLWGTGAARKRDARRFGAIAIDAAARLDERNGNDCFSQIAYRLLRRGVWRECPRVPQNKILWPTIVPHKEDSPPS